MTEADKKQVQKMIAKAANGAVESAQKLGEEIGTVVADKVMETIHAEIYQATGRRYGRWECECGLNSEPFYLDPMRIAHAMCKCGKQRHFVPLP